jgi:NAD(P)-dependent dehydrogenase (short-subunit alcohol dehydrogenase family)
MKDVKVALVSGANRGIGKEVVLQLAQLNYHVFLGARDLKKGAAAARELGFEKQITPVELDVTNQRSVDAAVQAVQRKFGRLDALINNAAIHYDTWQKGSSVDIDGTVKEAFETNLFGAWRLARAAIPLLTKSDSGRIVNVSSEGGSLSSMGGGTPAYSTSKAALNALTRVLAGELKNYGVLVNSVCPGWVATDMGGTGGRPVADGARGIVWAATLPNNGPSSGFFRDREPLRW